MKTWKTCVMTLMTCTALAMPAYADLSAQPKVAATQAALRDLWSGHVFWVRNVVVASIGHDAAAEAAAEKQVVANARQIADAIGPFYGKPASDKLFGLLAGHYGAVKTYLAASEKHDAKAQEAAMQGLVANADEITAFLSGANPYLPKDALRGLLLGHGGHHAQQIQQLLDHQYGDEAATWEHMRTHMNVIADALGDALAKQFPQKFQ